MIGEGGFPSGNMVALPMWTNTLLWFGIILVAAPSSADEEDKLRAHGLYYKNCILLMFELEFLSR